MDTKEIQDLIKFVAKQRVSEVHIEKDDLKITIKVSSNKERKFLPQISDDNIVTNVPPPKLTEVEEPMVKDNSEYIKAPMIGTFYVAPSPEEPPFLRVGDRVEKGQIVCIIEAMKLFNEIEAEVSGTVEEVIVSNETPVEYDQPLFKIKP